MILEAIAANYVSYVKSHPSMSYCAKGCRSSTNNGTFLTVSLLSNDDE